MSGKPIDEAVLELIAEARRAANVLHMAAHPHESPHKRPLLDAAATAEAALTAAQQQGQAVAWQYRDLRQGMNQEWKLTSKVSHDAHLDGITSGVKDVDWQVRALYTAPPPSVPVGVVVASEPLEYWLYTATDVQLRELFDSHPAVAERLRAALAQQPAAVDGARSGSSIMDGAVSFVEALATQHQEPTT